MTQQAQKQAQRNAVIGKIREHYGALGIPLDELSDRDIEQGVRQLAAAARESGTGSAQATEAMRRAVEFAKQAKAEAQAAADAAAAEAEDGAGASPG